MRLLRFVLFAWALLLLAACDGTHLAGTNDVELRYEVHGTATTRDAARAKVLSRLGAVHVAADVEASSPTELTITVDADSAQSVDDMLAWRGGLAVYEPDVTYAYTPADQTGLTAKTETANDGTIERYFSGERAAVTHAVNAGGFDAAHRVLIEALDDTTARTRVVKEPPALDLAEVIDFTEGAASENKDLVLYAKRDADLPARLALLPPTTFIALGRSVMAKRSPKELYVAARGSPARPALVIPMGAHIQAFARAHSVKGLLRTGTLPVLTRSGERVLPPDWIMAGAGVVVPLLLSIAWLFFVRRFDRSHPEPWWLVLTTFALGGLSVVPAGFLEWAFMTVSPYTNPSIMTLGGQAAAFPLALAAFTVVVGLSEEGGKLLGAWSLASHRREFDEPVDGIIYGAASSLGFAAVENIKYFAFGRLSSSIILARTFMSIPAHLFFGAIWGYALGKRLVSRKTSVLLFLCWAALMHGAFDTFLSLDGLQLAALVLNLVLASTFIILLRRALRHGAIGPGRVEAPPSNQRAFFPVGNPGLFALSAVGVHVFAAVLFLIGVGHQVMNHEQHARISYPFLIGSSFFVGMIGLCAYALAATMPLDVAVDEHGVTFAGRAVFWPSIRGARLYPLGARGVVRLETREGPWVLGPGPLERMQNLERVLHANLARSGAT